MLPIGKAGQVGFHLGHLGTSDHGCFRRSVCVKNIDAHTYTHTDAQAQTYTHTHTHARLRERHNSRTRRLPQTHPAFAHSLPDMVCIQGVSIGVRACSDCRITFLGSPWQSVLPQHVFGNALLDPMRPSDQS